MSRSLDALVPSAIRRNERAAVKDEATRLRERIAGLERELGRARRCVAELRRKKAERMADLQAELRRADCAIRMLTRIAFPNARRAAKEMERE